MAIAQICTTVSSRLETVPVKDGQIIFVRDSRKIYMDMSGYRTCYSLLELFDTEQDRLNKTVIPDGLYYVLESNMLYSYSENRNPKWQPLTEKYISPIFFGNLEDFPQEGNSKTMYVSDDVLYRWDNASKEYVSVANKTFWSRLEI